MDYDDPKTEERWCEERREEVAAYLQRQPGTYGHVGEWPAWHVAPHVAVWAIESKAHPGAVGWWAICGDLPTDCVSAAAAEHPREAVLAIAARWRVAAEGMARGHSSSDFSIGLPSNGGALAPLLLSRAELLQEWAANAELWDAP